MKKLWLAVGLIAFLSALIVIALAANPREPEYHGKKLTRWLDDLDNLSSPATQTNATLAIQEIGTNATPFLAQMLHAKDSPLKLKCMALLQRQHWVDFHFRTDRQQQSDAIRGLMILGPDAKAAIPDLANLLKDGSLEAGQTAGLILSRIGPPAVPALEDALTSSNNWARYEAAEALGNIAEPSCVPNLLRVLNDTNWLTRNIAVLALQRFPHQANVIVPALMSRLNDPDFAVQGDIESTLGTFGADAMPAFPKLLTRVADTNDYVSQAATLALMEIDFDATMAAFTNNLNSPDVNVRRTTAWAFTYFKANGEPAVPFLVKCLKDSDAQVREYAAVALRDIATDPDLVVPALIKNLDDPDPEVREVTAISLGGFGPRAKPAIPQILIIIEQNEDIDRRGSLYDALSQIDPQAAAKLSWK